MAESLSQIANIPNATTGARLVGTVHESIQYARTGELQHFVGAIAYYILDMVDGPLARKLNQETEFGRQFDPAVDKITGMAIGVAAAKNDKVNILPLMAVGFVNVSNAGAAVVGKLRGKEETVTKDGKRSQLFMNGGATLNILGNHLIEQDGRRVQKWGYTLQVGGTLLALYGALKPGMRATKHYWRKALEA